MVVSLVKNDDGSKMACRVYPDPLFCGGFSSDDPGLVLRCTATVHGDRICYHRAAGRHLTVDRESYPESSRLRVTDAVVYLRPCHFILCGSHPGKYSVAVSTFVTDQGFLDFFVSAIIVGALLGMPRTLLIKAGPRFFVPLIVTIVGVFAIMGAISAAAGEGFFEGMLFFAAPIMAGGIGLGAVPMAEMYAAQLGTDPSVFMGNLVAVTALANAVCVVFAGLLRVQRERQTVVCRIQRQR